MKCESVGCTNEATETRAITPAVWHVCPKCAAEYDAILADLEAQHTEDDRRAEQTWRMLHG